MSNYQREAILRCTRCLHEWKIYTKPTPLDLCPKCEIFNPSSIN